MGENTKIEWADHTFNPVIGCTKVSAACDHCYAESWANRYGQPELWNGHRRRTSAKGWQEPLRWARRAREGSQRPPRVFCASLSDVFDNQWEPEWRTDLFELIAKTPELDWLLLTKRPQNAWKMIQAAISSPAEGHWPWPNVWLGTTVENQEEADRRIPALLAVPAKRHFLSMEPLLGPVDLEHYLWPSCVATMEEHDREHGDSGLWCDERYVDWVIVGGESRPGARAMQADWARSIRDQCAAAGVPFHFKQWGEWSPDDVQGRTMTKIGKKFAGRALDGIEHNGAPS